jgi:hypothetical protein
MPAGYALLRLKVVAVTSDRLPGYSAVIVEMHLLEKVRLSRDTSKEIIASVYTGAITTLMRNGTPKVVADDVMELVREFAADFKASNSGGMATAKRIGRRHSGTGATSMSRR